VIVGFNFFGHDVGQRVSKAPEHSEQFRRQVRLYRSMLSTRGSFDLSRIRQNKGLTKLLVMAKRQRVKDELRRNQMQLTDQIWRRILKLDDPNHIMTVGDLVGELSNNMEGCWPNQDDVHVHINSMLSSKAEYQDDDKGRLYSIVASHFADKGKKKTSLVPLRATLNFVEVKKT